MSYSTDTSQNGNPKSWSIQFQHNHFLLLCPLLLMFTKCYVTWMDHTMPEPFKGIP